MSPTPILQVESVHRCLRQGGREIHILNNVSFEVEKGAWLAIEGPSGAGKSTLLGILAGIDRPTTGRVTLCDTNLTTLPETRLAHLRNEKIGVVFPSFALIPTLTARENVEAPLYIHPRRGQAHSLAANMLVQVGLGQRMDSYPHQLSGGEQQRVAIARALVTGPALLLVDEPTGSLDSSAGRQILDLLRMLRTEFDLTIVMATHDPAVAAQADRRLHLRDGRLVEQAEPQPAEVAA